MAFHCSFAKEGHTCRPMGCIQNFCTISSRIVLLVDNFIILLLYYYVINYNYHDWQIPLNFQLPVAQSSASLWPFYGLKSSWHLPSCCPVSWEEINNRKILNLKTVENRKKFFVAAASQMKLTPVATSESQFLNSLAPDLHITDSIG